MRKIFSKKNSLAFGPVVKTTERLTEQLQYTMGSDNEKKWFRASFGENFLLKDS
jgi:hypothetical protein